jgi:hypothetical protein
MNPPGLQTPWALARWTAQAWREWGWRDTGAGVAIGLASMFVFNYASFVTYAYFQPPNEPLLAWAIWNVVQFGWPYVLAMRVADKAAAHGVPPALAYGPALLLVLICGATILAVPVGLLFDLLGDPGLLLDPGHLLSSIADHSGIGTNPMGPLDLALSRLPGFVLCTAAYAQWRREQRSRARLHAAALERAMRERLLQSTRLLAMQAQVEPQLLFDALRRVRSLIADSRDAAERLLADLIAMLRALQPAAGATASSVGRECALVQSHARVADASALQPPCLVLDVDAPAAQARLAPLLLLPALRALAGHASATGWRVLARAEARHLRVTITPTRPEEPGARAALRALDLTPLALRVAAVHGPEARLTLTATGDAPALTLDAPLLPADDEPAAQSIDR